MVTIDHGGDFSRLHKLYSYHRLCMERHDRVDFTQLSQWFNLWLSKLRIAVRPLGEYLGLRVE
jgi:hypothetical protein